MKPQWDRDNRVLSLGGQVVKCFRTPAKNQLFVLQEFERLGWPSRITDPLPISYRQSPKLLLNETIKALNRNQQNRLIRFRGDGTGEGVLWELR